MPTEARTVSDVVSVYGTSARSRLLPRFSAAGVAYPPQSLALLVVKNKAQLEVWVKQATGSVFIHCYPVEALSGGPGPKLREGDRQVPEGIYQISGLNPNSRFHLSIKLNYPNAFDLRHAKLDGRTRPGSDIFIHSRASSVGCLAMGDTTIEELFVLACDVGMQNISVTIAPHDPRIEPLLPLQDLPWTAELYENIERNFSDFSGPV